MNVPHSQDIQLSPDIFRDILGELAIELGSEIEHSGSAAFWRKAIVRAAWIPENESTKVGPDAQPNYCPAIWIAVNHHLQFAAQAFVNPNSVNATYIALQRVETAYRILADAPRRSNRCRSHNLDADSNHATSFLGLVAPVVESIETFAQHNAGGTDAQRDSSSRTLFFELMFARAMHNKLSCGDLAMESIRIHEFALRSMAAGPSRRRVYRRVQAIRNYSSKSRSLAA